MGLLDRKKRQPAPMPPGTGPVESAPAEPSGSPPAPDPQSESLRDMLIGAVAARDSKLLTSLIAGNRRVISARFPEWQRVPEAIRDNPATMQRYAAGLVSVAEFFRDRLDDPSLIARLAGPGGSTTNLRGQWEQGIAQADAHLREGNFDAAEELLRRIVAALGDVPVDAPIPFHAVTHSRLAQVLFAKADVVGAAGQMRQALALSEQRRDANGVGASLRGMYEICRYAGQFSEAADSADRIAAEYTSAGNATEAARWTRQAALVRSGEPLCRVVFFSNDRQYELDEAPPIFDGSLRYGFVRNRPPIQLADLRTHQGMQLAGQLKFAEAVEQFAAAAAVDPHDPNPHFQSAIALMHLKKFPEAVEQYDMTERLAPGWMNARAARWIAVEIAPGRIEPDIFAVMLTEEMPPDSASWEQKLTLVEQAIARAGELPPLLHYKGRCLMRTQRPAEAQAALRSALEKSSEPDLRTRVMMDIQFLLPDGDEKRRMLEDAIALNGNLIAAAVARIELLAMETRQKTAPM